MNLDNLRPKIKCLDSGHDYVLEEVFLKYLHLEFIVTFAKFKLFSN